MKGNGQVNQEDVARSGDGAHCNEWGLQSSFRFLSTYTEVNVNPLYGSVFMNEM